MTDRSDCELTPERKQELVRVLEYESWSEVPDIVQNVFEAPKTNIVEFIERHRAAARDQANK